MLKKIAILRGINVGRKRRILMKDLKSLFEALGFLNIKTYIQSGNVIFEVCKSSEENNKKLENIIEEGIYKKFGFDVPVIIRTSEDLQRAVKINPFYDLSDKNTDITKLHLAFLKQIPEKENLEKIKTLNYLPDKYVIIDQDIFIYCEGKYHQSKLTNNFFEKKLGVGATTRNWKTVLQLIELTK